MTKKSKQSELSDISSDADAVPPPVKAKRVMTPAQLENLKKAREKAVEKRKELGDIKRREEEAKQAVLDARIKNIKKLEDSVKQEKSKPAKTAKPPPESESEEEIEEVKAKPKPRAKPKPKPKSDEKLAVEVSKEELRKRILREVDRQAHASIFPNKFNPYN
jgi:hypothetical protein